MPLTREQADALFTEPTAPPAIAPAAPPPRPNGNGAGRLTREQADALFQAPAPAPAQPPAPPEEPPDEGPIHEPTAGVAPPTPEDAAAAMDVIRARPEMTPVTPERPIQGDLLISPMDTRRHPRVGQTQTQATAPIPPRQPEITATYGGTSRPATPAELPQNYTEMSPLEQIRAEAHGRESMPLERQTLRSGLQEIVTKAALFPVAVVNRAAALLQAGRVDPEDPEVAQTMLLFASQGIHITPKGVFNQRVGGTGLPAGVPGLEAQATRGETIGTRAFIDLKRRLHDFPDDQLQSLAQSTRRPEMAQAAREVLAEKAAGITPPAAPPAPAAVPIRPAETPAAPETAQALATRAGQFRERFQRLDEPRLTRLATEHRDPAVQMAARAELERRAAPAAPEPVTPPAPAPTEPEPPEPMGLEEETPTEALRSRLQGMREMGDLIADPKTTDYYRETLRNQLETSRRVYERDFTKLTRRMSPEDRDALRQRIEAEGGPPAPDVGPPAPPTPTEPPAPLTREEADAMFTEPTAPPAPPEDPVARIDNPPPAVQDALALLNATPSTYHRDLAADRLERVLAKSKNAAALVKGWSPERLVAARVALVSGGPILTPYQKPTKPEVLTQGQVTIDAVRGMPRIVKIGDQTWWTDGHFLEQGEPPKGLSKFASPDTPERSLATGVQNILDTFAKRGTENARIVARQRGLDVRLRQSQDILWVATGDSHSLVSYQAAPVNHLVSRHPGAELVQSKAPDGGLTAPLGLYDKGQLVGMVMPMRGDPPAELQSWMDANPERWPTPKPQSGKPPAKTPKGETKGQKKRRIETAGYQGEPAAMAGETALTVTEATPPAAPILTTVGPPGPPDVIKSRHEIIKALLDVLHVPAFMGRLGKYRQAVAWYRVPDRVIRSRIAQNLPTIAHEVGHHLQALLWPDTLARDATGKVQGFRVRVRNPSAGPLGGDFTAFAKELVPMAYKGAAVKIIEGLGEFVRLYLTDPAQALARAPLFSAEFERRLSLFPKEQAALIEYREDTARYIAAPALARVIAQIDFGDDVGGPIARGVHFGRQMIANALSTEFWRKAGNTSYTYVVNRQNPIAVALKDLAAMGAPETQAQMVEAMTQLTLGSMGRAHQMLDYGTINFADKTINGKGLAEIIQGKNRKILDAYLLSRRTLELAQRVGLTPKMGTPDDITGVAIKDAEAVVNQYQAELEPTAVEITAWENRRTQYYADALMLSPEKWAAMQLANKLHVPLHRSPEDYELGFAPMPKGKKFATLAQPIKQFRGSARRVLSPLETMVRETPVLIGLADRNQVMNALVKLVESTNFGAFIMTKIDRGQKPVARMTLAEMVRELKKNGIGLDPALEQDPDLVDKLQKAVTLFRQDMQTPTGEQIVHIHRGGEEPELWQVKDKELFDTVTGLSPSNVSLVMQIARAPASLLRWGLTRDPSFALWLNFFRDQVTAGLATRSNYKPFIDWIPGLFHVLKADDVYQRFYASGAAMATLSGFGRTSTQARLRQLMRTPMQRGLSYVWNPKAALDFLSTVVEEATRVQEFNRLTQQGQPWWIAGQGAREVSQDFPRMGLMIQGLNMIVPFFGAWIGGIDKAARTIWDNPARVAIGSAILAGVSLLTYYANKDCLAYQQAPQPVKDSFWIWCTGDSPRLDPQNPAVPGAPLTGQTWRIPKGFDVAMTVATVAERMVGWIDGQDPHLGDNLWRLAGQDFLRSPYPAALMPWLEALSGWRFYQERPLSSRSTENLSPAYQASPYATEITKRMGRAFDVSPDKLEHLVEGYGGTVGVNLLRLVDTAAQEAGVLKPSAGTPPDWNLADWPEIGRFLVRFPSTNAKSITEFFDRWTAGQQAHNTLQMLKRENRRDEIHVWTREKRDELRDYGAMKPYYFGRGEGLEGPTNGIEDLYKMVRTTRADPKLEGEAKRRQMDSATIRMIRTARAALIRADLVRNKPATDREAVAP